MVGWSIGLFGGRIVCWFHQNFTDNGCNALSSVLYVTSLHFVIPTNSLGSSLFFAHKRVAHSSNLMLAAFEPFPHWTFFSLPLATYLEMRKKKCSWKEKENKQVKKTLTKIRDDCKAQRKNCWQSLVTSTISYVNLALFCSVLMAVQYSLKFYAHPLKLVHWTLVYEIFKRNWTREFGKNFLSGMRWIPRRFNTLCFVA